MRQERFAEQAQETLVASQELVRHHRHSQWDVEHILLVLLEQGDGLAIRILEEFRVDVQMVKQKVESRLLTRWSKSWRSDLLSGRYPWI